MEYERILLAERDATKDPLALSEAVILSSGLGVYKLCEIFLRSYTILRRAVGIIYTPGNSLFLMPLVKYLIDCKRGYLYVSSPKTKPPATADVWILSPVTFVSDIVRGVLDLGLFDGLLLLTAGKTVPLIRVLAPVLRKAGCWIKVISDQPLAFATITNLYNIQPRLEELEAYHIVRLQVIHRAMPLVSQDLTPPKFSHHPRVLEAQAPACVLFMDELVKIDISSEHPVHSFTWHEIRRWALLLMKKEPRYEAIARLPQEELCKHADLLFSDDYIRQALKFLYHMEFSLPENRDRVLSYYRSFLDHFQHPLIQPTELRNYFDSLQTLCKKQQKTALIQVILRAIETATEDILADVEAHASNTSSQPYTLPTRIVVLLGTQFCATELATALISNTNIEIINSQSDTITDPGIFGIKEPPLRSEKTPRGFTSLSLNSNHNKEEQDDRPSAYEHHNFRSLFSSNNKLESDEVHVPFSHSKSMIVQTLTKAMQTKLRGGTEIVLIPTCNDLFSLTSTLSLPLYEKLLQLGLDTVATIISCGASIEAIRALERIRAEHQRFGAFKQTKISLTIIEGGPLSVVTNYPLLVSNVESEVMKTLHTAAMHMAVSTYYDRTMEIDFTLPQWKCDNANGMLTPVHSLYIDHRELRSTVPAELFVMSKGLKLPIMQLSLGDYILSSKTIVERKSEHDLISSLRCERLTKQLERLNAQFSFPILLCSIPVGRPHDFARLDLQARRSSSTNTAAPLSMTSQIFGLLYMYRSVRMLWSTDTAFASLLLRIKLSCIKHGESDLTSMEAENLESANDEFVKQKVMNLIADFAETDYRQLNEKHTNVYKLVNESKAVLASETSQYASYKISAIATEPLINLLPLLDPSEM